MRRIRPASIKHGERKSSPSKITELKKKGVSFLGCVAFVQLNKKLSLKDARELTLELDAYTKNEKKAINKMNNLMQSEFEEE